MNKLAGDFDVTYGTVFIYTDTSASGLRGRIVIFMSPWGFAEEETLRSVFGLFHSDVMVLNLQAHCICFTDLSRIGLCVTKSFIAFCGISFITSVTTATPQLMLPLIGDLAPPHRRSTALSVVVSGMLLGMLIARLLSGVVIEFVG